MRVTTAPAGAASATGTPLSVARTSATRQSERLMMGILPGAARSPEALARKRLRLRTTERRERDRLLREIEHRIEAVGFVLIGRPERRQGERFFDEAQRGDERALRVIDRTDPCVR